MSHFITFGRRPQFLVLILLTALGQGCSSSTEQTAPATATELQDEVRLKEDRSQLDELRAQIPEDVKKENDELAFTLNLTSEGKKSPSEIWSKFNETVRRRREVYDKTERKVRDEFNKNEKKKRDEFLANQKKVREDFFKGKPAADDRQKFSSDQDSKRREFFDDERDKRKDFESDVRQKRSDFDAYLREKRGAFDNEMKVYSKTYYERKRTEAAVERKKAKDEYEKKKQQQNQTQTGSQGSEQAQPQPADPDLEQFKTIPAGKGTPLQPSTEE